MQDDLNQAAGKRSGVVLAADLGDRPDRAARRRRLVEVVPGAYAAQTQPIDARVLVVAVSATVNGPHAFTGACALWLLGVSPQPESVEVAIRHSTRLALGKHVRVRRAAASVLTGRRQVEGHWVVALEVAVVQAAADLDAAGVLALLELVLRSRRTTIPRLRAVCRRGLSGSAAVRAGLDTLAGTSLDEAVRRLRAALDRRGVTGLETEVRFVNSDGASCYADLLHRPTMTVLELDGFLTHIERSRFRADRRRDRWLQAEHGVLTVRIDVAEDVEAVADEVVVILDRRGCAAA